MGKTNWLFITGVLLLCILLGWLAGCSDPENLDLLNWKPTRSYEARLENQTQNEIKNYIRAQIVAARSTVNDLWPIMALLGFLGLCGTGVGIAFIVRRENNRQIKVLMNGVHIEKSTLQKPV